MVDLKKAKRSELQNKLDMTEWEARIISENGPYTDEEQFKARLTARYEALKPSVNFMEKYWPAIQDAINTKKATF